MVGGADLSVLAVEAIEGEVLESGGIRAIVPLEAGVGEVIGAEVFGRVDEVVGVEESAFFDELGGLSDEGAELVNEIAFGEIGQRNLVFGRDVSDERELGLTMLDDIALF